MRRRDSFVGRDHEISLILDDLTRSRTSIVSLTGPGGIGKTRLAEEAFARAEPEFEDGAMWLDLSSTEDAGLLSSQVARRLSLSEAQEIETDELIRRTLGTRQLLIALDNCEQLLPAVATWVESIARSSPQVQFLVTSRERLNIAGEAVHVVDPLPMPTTHELEPEGPAVGATGAAVQLFLDRARAIGGYEPTEVDVEPIVAICKMVDGIPLGIELAAAHLRALDPSGLRSRLAEDLDVLSGGYLGYPERHRTLRATIEWSISLLDEMGRAALIALTAFRGPFSWDAALAVLGTTLEQESEPELIDVIGGLVDKSLVQAAEPIPGVKHLRLLETVRRVVRDAAEPPAVLRAEQAHARHYRDLARDAERALRTEEQLHWVGLLSAQYPNLRAAIERAIDDSLEGAVRAVEITNGLFWYWNADSDLVEGRALTEAAIAADGIADRVLVEAQRYMSLLCWLQGDFEEADEWLRSSDALAVTEDAETSAFGATIRGRIHLYRGEVGQALESFEQAATNARSADDGEHTLGLALTGLGVSAGAQGLHDRARAACAEALALYQRLGDPFFTALALGDLGWVLHLEGRHQEAVARLEESLELRRAIDATWLVAQTLHQLAVVNESLGRIATAIPLLEEGLALAIDVGARTWEERSRIALERLESPAAPASDAVSAPWASEAPVIVRLLGPFEVVREGRTVPTSEWSYAKPREILAYLMESPPRTKEEIGLAFWPDASSTQLRRNLRSALYQLRKSLGGREWVVYQERRYSFNRDLDYDYDVERFEEELELANRASDTAEETTHLETAVGVYRGDLAEDLAVDDWAHERRQHLRLRMIAALRRLASTSVEAGDHDRTVTTCRRIIEFDPYDDAAHIGVMRELARRGDRAAAIEHYDRVRRLLETDLGADPTDEMIRLARQIRSDAWSG